MSELLNLHTSFLKSIHWPDSDSKWGLAKIYMAQVGVEIWKLSIYIPWGQRRASVIRRAWLGSSWRDHRLPRRLYSWEYRLHATKRRPLPNRYKKGIWDPEELPCGWDSLTVDNQHQEPHKWMGQLWFSPPPLQRWRKCQPPRCNIRSLLRDTVLQYLACVVLKHVPR